MNHPPVPCTPSMPCWCEKHPNNPNCQNVETVPIDNSFFIIIIVLLTIYKTFKKLK